MSNITRILLAALAGAVLLMTSGCALPRRIDSDVQSFTASVPAVTPALYRFERLPSQNPAKQDQVEAMAAQALAKVGLTPAPLVSGAIAGTAAAAPSARYAVQVSVQVSVILSPYNSTIYGPPYWGYGIRQRGYSSAFGISMEPNWYRHAVRIVMRDSVSGLVAYETTATFDGPWGDSGHLLPVVLDAALQGYPHPPEGPRKVIIELPATPAAADAP